MAESYDVIIIGTGAGGGTPADTLDVVETSLFPSIGAVHPALTVMANAIRAGEHLIGRLG
jgi:choline dehydrogenase-like flavoprotein